MGNILSDIVEEIDVKPNKTKLILKWVLRIGGTLVGAAFIFGQLKMGHLNRLDGMETELLQQGKTLIEMKAENQSNFDATNTRIDKVYSDGVLLFNDFQEYNNKQLELIIDYGAGNKDMLKRMLEISALKQQQIIETQVEQAKKENPVIKPTNPPMEQPVIGVKQGDVVFTPVFDDPYVGHFQMIEMENGDTINYLTGATEKYIKSLDTKIYLVGAMTESPDYPGRYDVAYRSK